MTDDRVPLTTSRARVVRAAWERIAEFGIEHVVGRELTAKVLSEQAGMAKSTIQSAFSKTMPGGGKSFSPQHIVEHLLDEAARSLIEEARANGDGYRQAADVIRRGGGREVIRAAVSADLEDYDSPRDDALARERLYYFFVALGHYGRSTPQHEKLRAAQEQVIDDYVERAYPAMLEASRRRLAGGCNVRDLANAISALLEGFTVYRRLGAEFDVDLVTDAVMRLFYGYTVPSGRPGRSSLYANDLDLELFGRPPRNTNEPVDANAVVHHDSPSLYAATFEAIRDLRSARSDHPDAKAISLASLLGHGSQLAGNFAAAGDGMKKLLVEHLRLPTAHDEVARPRLRRVVSLLSSEQLNHELEEIEELAKDPELDFEMRGLTMHAAPPLGQPLIVGLDRAFLARERRGERTAENGLELHGRAAASAVQAQFDDIWRDAHVLCTRAGPYRPGIAAARRALERLASLDDF